MGQGLDVGLGIGLSRQGQVEIQGLGQEFRGSAFETKKRYFYDHVNIATAKNKINISLDLTKPF